MYERGQKPQSFSELMLIWGFSRINYTNRVLFMWNFNTYFTFSLSLDCVYLVSRRGSTVAKRELLVWNRLKHWKLPTLFHNLQLSFKHRIPISYTRIRASVDRWSNGNDQNTLQYALCASEYCVMRGFNLFFKGYFSVYGYFSPLTYKWQMSESAVIQILHWVLRFLYKFLHLSASHSFHNNMVW